MELLSAKRPIDEDFNLDVIPFKPPTETISAPTLVTEEKEFVYVIPEGYGGDPVSELESRLTNSGARSYDAIDKLMRSICKKHDITPRKLHDDFKAKHNMIPDEWVKKNDDK